MKCEYLFYYISKWNYIDINTADITDKLDDVKQYSWLFYYISVAIT